MITFEEHYVCPDLVDLCYDHAEENASPLEKQRLEAGRQFVKTSPLTDVGEKRLAWMNEKGVDIEKECSITHPTALGLLDNLSKKGFVVKVVNPEDARSKVISLTDKTKNMQKELENVGDYLENRLTEALTQQERRQLLTLLQKTIGKSRILQIS